MNPQENEKNGDFSADNITNDQNTEKTNSDSGEKSSCNCGSECDTKSAKKGCKKEDKKLKEENEKLSSSLSELTDRYTRMLAEYDNFRKRAAKEREGVYSDACADVLKEILVVKDSLEMAMKFADDGEFSKGVSMTLSKFDEILKKLGVEEFGNPGDEFDPNLHNAVFHTEDDSLGENQIAEVMMKGYKKGDKIIRYAMVKVAN